LTGSLSEKRGDLCGICRRNKKRAGYGKERNCFPPAERRLNTAAATIFWGREEISPKIHWDTSEIGVKPVFSKGFKRVTEPALKNNPVLQRKYPKFTTYKRREEVSSKVKTWNVRP